MKKEDFFEVLGGIDENLVKRAKQPVKKKINWKAWGAMAACLAMVVWAGIRLTDNDTAQPAVPELPKLTVEKSSGSFGFEGYMAYDPDELTGVCPWNESMTLETLPVYKNKYPADEAGWSSVEQQVKLEFDPPVELPEGLHFTHYSSYEEMEAVAEYLKAEYAGELDMVKPVTDIQGGDRDIYGRQMYTIHFYDGAGDVAQQLVSRSLANQRWHCNDDGQLSLVWKDAYDLSEKVGDYPIITAAEARTLLCNGNYITTVPYAMPGEGYIVRVELLYRRERTAKYFMPYYRFLVEVPEAYFGQPRTEEQYGVAVDGEPAGGQPSQQPVNAADDGTGMKTYGAYYVPAVRGEYLTEMPVWDGSFN